MPLLWLSEIVPSVSCPCSEGLQSTVVCILQKLKSIKEYSKVFNIEKK